MLEKGNRELAVTTECKKIFKIILIVFNLRYKVDNSKFRRHKPFEKIKDI